MPEIRRTVALTVLGLLSGLFLALGLAQAAADSPTVDEGPDVTAAVVSVGRGDLRLNPEHGILHHLVAGVPAVLFTDPVIPDTEAYADGDWFDYTDDFISANDRAGRLDEVLLWARVGPLLVGMAAGWVLYALGARFGGRVGGLLAAGLWFTTPYVVGLAHLQSLDVTYSFAVLAVTLAIVRDREAPTLRRAVVLGVCLGGALLVRHSAVVLAPVAIGFVVADRLPNPRRVSRALAAVALVVLGVVWITYRTVDPTPVTGPPRDRFDGLVAAARADSGPARLVLSVPMPIEWRAGFAYLVETADERPAYAFGHQWEGSRWWFFPASAGVKLPLSASLTVGLGLAGLRRRRRVRAAVPLAAVTAMSGLFLFAQPLNLGLRLALPLVALSFVAAGPAATFARSRRGAAVLGLLVGLQLVAVAVAHPTSRAWTPPPFSDGYRVVSDSSVDFGQANGAVRARHLVDPFVAASLIAPRGFDALRGVPRIEDSAPRELVGYVAASATVLTERSHGQLSWLRAYCPVEVVDGAVLVYRFTTPPETEIPGPSTPAPPCTGEVSRRDPGST